MSVVGSPDKADTPGFAGVAVKPAGRVWLSDRAVFGEVALAPRSSADRLGVEGDMFGTPAPLLELAEVESEDVVEVPVEPVELAAVFALVAPAPAVALPLEEAAAPLAPAPPEPPPPEPL